ncbi:hypothetical protein HDE_03447 [Halotydeus destructor]|nr:hypothetical protein HDE_03447 [Halotydeus destructor]
MVYGVIFYLASLVIAVQSWDLELSHPCSYNKICAQRSPRQIYAAMVTAIYKPGSPVARQWAACNPFNGTDGATIARVMCASIGGMYSEMMHECLTAKMVTKEQWLNTIEPSCTPHPWTPLPRRHSKMAADAFLYSPAPSCRLTELCKRRDVVQHFEKIREVAASAGPPLADAHQVCRPEITGTMDSTGCC